MQPLNDNVDIFVYTHKPFRQIVSNSIYKVLTCSRDDFSGFTVPVYRDYTGDNISDKNLMYNEYTGIYWLWKNYELKKYVGINHYNRYYTFMDKPLDIEALMSYFSLIISKRLDLANPVTRERMNNRDSYAYWHNVEDFDLLEQVIHEKYPEYITGFDRMKERDYIFNSSMFIMSKESFNEYCSFIFDILGTYNQYHGHYTADDYKAHVMSNRDKYIKPSLPYYTVEKQARLLGYIAERAMNAYLFSNRHFAENAVCELEWILTGH